MKSLPQIVSLILFFSLTLGAGAAAQAQTGATMALLAGGTFNRGDYNDGNQMADAPKTTVTLTNSFLMDSNLVTCALWQEVYNYAVNNQILTYSFSTNLANSGSALPEQSMTWYDAVKWCNARSQMEGLTPCYYADTGLTQVYASGIVALTTSNVNWAANGYRLPTEAEWEYAARGGLSEQRFPLGMLIGHYTSQYEGTNTIAHYTTQGIKGAYDLGPLNIFPTGPVQAGNFPPNAFGLFDMAGNLEEWCFDYYSKTYYSGAPANNPTGPTAGSERILRGGDWSDGPGFCRCAYRNYMLPTAAKNVVGFRCVIGSASGQSGTPAQAQTIDFDSVANATNLLFSASGFPTSIALVATSAPLGTTVGFQITSSSAPGIATLDPNNNTNLLIYGSGTFTVTATVPQVSSNGSIYLGTNAALTFVVSTPMLTITAPFANEFATNAAFTITGTTTDSLGVTNVFYSLNNGDWTSATTSDNWSDWTANAALTLGTNTLSAYGVDASGNVSPTNTVIFSYVENPTITVNVGAGGTVTPNYNGQILTLGQSYTMKAVANPGFAFAGWTGTIVTNNPTLTFVMSANPTFTATFNDVQAPTNQIITPTAGQRWSNAVFTVTGKAGDNAAVSNVFYSLNNSGWSNAVTANGFTNWTAPVTLMPGTNTIAAYAVDTSGNVSKTNTVSFVGVLSAQLTVNVGVGGTVSPNDNGAWLTIGQVYSLTAKTNAGFAFAGWTGSIATNKPILNFVMASNLVFNANFADVAKPTNQIIAPKAGQRWSNSVFTVTGKAGDNVAVSNVFYSLNKSGWSNAITANGFTNWTAPVTLMPGTNTIAVYAVDTSGNVSKTNTVSFVGVLSAQLTVNVGVGGAVSPNDNGAWLTIGQVYSLTAKTNAGFAFAGWTGSITTNKPILTFVMASNLVFNANFADVAKPTNQITAPTAGQRWSNSVFTVTGKAGDNVAVSNVFYSLNNSGWSNAVTANGFTNWTAPVTLTVGTNTILAYAMDTSGNRSTTNSVKFIFVSPPQVSVSLRSRVVSEGSLQIQLSGPQGTVVVLESSTDLIHWSPVQTNALPAGGLSIPQSMNQAPVQFFRMKPQ